jgi:regulatory protein
VKNRVSYTVDEAISKMERFCVYQDRCHLEVTNKLREMQMIPQAIDYIVHHLITHDFLNEERFARSFARGKFRIKKWGRERITRELKKRHISRFNIKAGLSEIETEEYHITLAEISAKKWARLTDNSLAVKKKKLANYLFYRGWEADLIYQKINEFNS